MDMGEGQREGIFEFKKSFFGDGRGKANLKIGSDFRYAAYINGKFVSNGQLADLPEHKFINSKNVTDVMKSGENVFTVIAVHTGKDFNQARTMIGWGEHLSDGRIGTFVGGGSFAEEFIFKEGVNEFENYWKGGAVVICVFSLKRTRSN